MALLLIAGVAACGDDDGGDEGGGLSDLTTTSVEGTDETTTTTEDDGDDEETTTTTEGSEVDAPDDWTVVDQAEFSLALPPGWQEANEMLDDPEFSQYVDEILGGEENLDQMLAQLDLMAVDSSSVNTGFATNLNAIVNPSSPMDTIESLETQIGPALLDSMGAEVTNTERIDLAGQDALRVEYDYTLEGSTLKGVQYYVLGERLSGVLTFTGSEDLADPEGWQEIADTFVLAD